MERTSDTSRLCELYDAGLFDLDGVLYLGSEPIDYAPKILEQVRADGFTAVFVTNNASRTPQTVAQHLSSLDIPAHACDIVTSAQIGVQLAQSLLGQEARVLLCGAQGLTYAAEEAGLCIVDSADDKPDGVIHGFSPEMNWARLSEAVLAIRGGATYITTNLDRLIPRERGLMMGVGSLAKAITHATGVKPISGAKPEPQMFQYAADRARAHKPLVVGDNLDTDIQGAYASGFPSLHVLTGTHNARDVIFAPISQRPRYLGDDMRCLSENYPDITMRDESGDIQAVIPASQQHSDHEELARLFDTADTGIIVSVAHARVHCTRDYIDINGTTYTYNTHDKSKKIEVTLDEYRALVHALWLFCDRDATNRSTMERYIPEVKVRH